MTLTQKLFALIITLLFFELTIKNREQVSVFTFLKNELFYSVVRQMFFLVQACTYRTQPAKKVI